MIVNCKNCGAYLNSRCGLTNRPTNLDDYCSKAVPALQECELCGQLILGSAVIDNPDESPHIICYDCFKRIGTCDLCIQRIKCDFETNPIAIPKVTVKSDRRGPMVMQTRVKNPARIQETCIKNCKCWNGENCCKEYGNCKNYKHIYI